MNVLDGQSHKLKDGSEVIIRPLRQDEFNRSYKFFCDLPEEDRAYLRVDVTDPEVVKVRMATNPLENAFRLVALQNDCIVADGTLTWPDHGWMSHVGEVRVIIAKEYRRLGMATLLYRKLFIQAVKENLEKIEAKMMPEQVSAMKCVERLGFKKEGVLSGFVKDGTGNLRDLIIMSVHVGSF